MKITVSVSIYNIEDYLRQALDSILSQSYGDIEVIMVDDGSTDKSADICDEYEERYENFIAVHKKNNGLSSARNAGLLHATGDYIVFLDGDDFFDKDYIKSFAEVIADNPACDCVFGRMSFFFEENGKTEPDEWLSETEKTVFETGKQAFVALIKEQKAMRMGVRGAYRRGFLLENNLLQDEELKYSEDQEWTVRILLYAQRTAVNLFPGYYYRMNRTGSLMNTLSLKKVAYTANIYQRWYTWCLQNENDEFYKTLYYQIGERYSSLICDSARKIKKEEKKLF